MLACQRLFVGLILVSLALAGSEANVNQTTCDRYRSRKTSIVVQDYILPKAEKLGYTLPEACLVHPKRNMCVRHHATKQRSCGIAISAPPQVQLCRWVFSTAHVCVLTWDFDTHAATRSKRRRECSCSGGNGSVASVGRRCVGRTTWTFTWTRSIRTS